MVFGKAERIERVAFGDTSIIHFSFFIIHYPLSIPPKEVYLFILASQSPRRRELLSMLGLSFDIVTADIDETMDASVSVEDAVTEISRKKAEAVGKDRPGRLIVSADTIVTVDGRVLGKPHSEAEAHAMLRSLSGRTHTVMTAFCLYLDGRTETHVEKTDVVFKPLSDEEIDAYIATGSPMDKAGAYGIQDGAAVFVERLIGDYYNVMGLPVCELAKRLRTHGVPVLGTVIP